MSELSIMLNQIEKIIEFPDHWKWKDCLKVERIPGIDDRDFGICHTKTNVSNINDHVKFEKSYFRVVESTMYSLSATVTLRISIE